MNRLSLNSDGAFRTIMQSRTPHARNNTSTKEAAAIKRKDTWLESDPLFNQSLGSSSGTMVSDSSPETPHSSIKYRAFIGNRDQSTSSFSSSPSSVTNNYVLDVNVWSHQSVLQRNAFRSSVVRPTTTSGGATIVRISRNALTAGINTRRGDDWIQFETTYLQGEQQQHLPPHRIPRRFNNDASVILTAFADRTRNITEIL